VADPEPDVDIKESLGKKVGPLPLGVWILAVGGGLVFAWYMRSRGGGGEEEAADPGRSTATAPGIGGGAGGGGGSGGGDTTRPATNEEWYQLAHQRLMATGLYDALLVDTALKAYLSGSRQLTAQEQIIVSHAIRLIGPPPVPTPVPPPGSGEEEEPGWEYPPYEDPPVQTTPPPVTGTPSTPADPRPPALQAGSGETTYTVVSGDNLYEIAERRVGKPKAGAKEPTHTRVYRDKIYERNSAEIEWQARKHGLTFSNYGQSLFSGTRLVLPPKTGSSGSSASSSGGTEIRGATSGTAGVPMATSPDGQYRAPNPNDPYASNDFFSGGQLDGNVPAAGVDGPTYYIGGGWGQVAY